MSKNIGIIGSGVVAQSLGEGFIKYGYQVMLWCIPGIANNEWTYAFKLLTK